MSTKDCDRSVLDHGWFGYVVFTAVTIVAVTNSLPLGVFGIIFGEFLSTFADETTATSLSNGMFNTILSIAGLVANMLLNKWSCRSVGLLGALFTVIGSFGVLLANDLALFILFFGVFQGFGYGLLLPASLTSLNGVFDKKLQFMMSLSQAIMVACCMAMPPYASAVMKVWGFRGGVLSTVCITLLNIPASLFLTRFRFCQNVNSTIISANEPFLKEEISIAKEDKKIIHIADRSISVSNLHAHNSQNEKNAWKSLIRSIDFSLMTNLRYLNLSVGISLSYTSDVCFITLIPVILTDIGFDSSQVAKAMTIFFGADLLSRILLSVVSSMTTIRSRYLVWGSSLLSMIFRFAFMWCQPFNGKIFALASLGFLRCFIQTPLPLVIVEEYPKNFANAYTLYMVICGIISLVSGIIIGIVKNITGSNEMVCHLLTSCYLICVVAWLCEMTLSISKKKITAVEV